VSVGKWMSSSGMNCGPKRSEVEEARRSQEVDLQVTTRVCPYLVWGEGTVVNFTLYVTIRLPLVGEHLEEGSAS